MGKTHELLKRLFSAPCVASRTSRSCIPVSDRPAKYLLLKCARTSQRNLKCPVLTLYSAEAWEVTSELGFKSIIHDRAVARRDVPGVRRVKAGQWREVEIAKERGFGKGFLQLQGA